MEHNAELLFVLDTLGVAEYLSIYENQEEVKQLCNKIGRPELFTECMNEINNYNKETGETNPNLIYSDSDYETESEPDTETEEECEAELISIQEDENGFLKLVDVN
tara:strand:- start:263 stop:580 length:318 start_codon:yes stop_codon:yes gene_type:complete